MNSTMPMKTTRKRGRNATNEGMMGTGEPGSVFEFCDRASIIDRVRCISQFEEMRRNCKGIADQDLRIKTLNCISSAKSRWIRHHQRLNDSKTIEGLVEDIHTTFDYLNSVMTHLRTIVEGVQDLKVELPENVMASIEQAGFVTESIIEHSQMLKHKLAKYEISTQDAAEHRAVTPADSASPVGPAGPAGPAVQPFAKSPAPVMASPVPSADGTSDEVVINSSTRRAILKPRSRTAYVHGCPGPLPAIIPVHHHIRPAKHRAGDEARDKIQDGAQGET